MTPTAISNLGVFTSIPLTRTFIDESDDAIFFAAEHYDENVFTKRSALDSSVLLGTYSFPAGGGHWICGLSSFLGTDPYGNLFVSTNQTFNPLLLHIPSLQLIRNQLEVI